MSVETIAVVGAGTMGAGIAQLAATHGCTVHLIDVNDEILQRAQAGIAKRLDRSVEKGRISETERGAIMDRIQATGAIANLSGVDLAIEAVVENLNVKHEVFKRLDGATPSTAVLATNTSSLSISKIAEAVEAPDRIVGMHFFNPAVIMPLVEVIAGQASSNEAVEAAFAAARAWGKTPVKAKDTPGFIVNRVARGFYLEAMRLLDEGVGDVYEIDNVMRTHGGFKMGPFELMDLIGIDVNLSVSESVWRQMGEPARLTPHEIQRRLVDQGHLGRKTGRGFYVHDNGAALPAYPVDRKSFDMSPLLRDAMRSFSSRAGVGSANSTEQYMFCRILGAVINEAGIAFSEGVASSDDIDTAMVKGTNYPKGPLAWADEIGHHTVRGLLKGLNDTVRDGRYEPAALFCE